MRAIIVGSGPSAAGFVPPEDVTVIAVNGAADWLSRFDYWFTLDPSRANLRRMMCPSPGARYVAAMPGGVSLPPHVSRYRRLALRGLPEPQPRYTPQWWLWRWSAICGLSETRGVIHTGNSAWGALGLAYHLGAERVALVGIDASAEERLEGGRPNNLSHLPLLIESAMAQIDVINCGRMESRVPRYTIDEGMKWLMR